MSAARIIVAVVAERYTLCAQCMGCWMLGEGMKREASTFMLSWWQRGAAAAHGGAMLMAVPRQCSGSSAFRRRFGKADHGRL